MAEYVNLVSMNLSDPTLQANDGGFQTIDPGTYDFEITKTANATSQAGNNTLKVTAKVIGPEDSPMFNRPITNTFVIAATEYHRSRMLGFIQGVGGQLDQNGAFERDALVGLRFTADVEKRTARLPDKMGNEVEKEFTSWLRERPLEEVAPAPAARTTAPVRKPAPANGAARPQPPR